MKLRHARKEDLAFILGLWGDRETMDAVGGPVSMTDAQAGAWFAEMVHPGTPSNCYRLIVGDEGELVGEVSCHRFDFTTGRAELNIKVLSTARGRGYGSRALRLFTRLFFESETARELIDDVSLGKSVCVSRLSFVLKLDRKSRKSCFLEQVTQKQGYGRDGSSKRI